MLSRPHLEMVPAPSTAATCCQTVELMARQKAQEEAGMNWAQEQ